MSSLMVRMTGFCGEEHRMSPDDVLIRPDLRVLAVCPVWSREIICGITDRALLSLLEAGADIEIGDPECL